MPTVRINTYDQNTGVNGAALPQANIPGNFQIEANAARQFRMLGNALRGLAGVELRMRDAQRADQLNAARVNYMNDISREQERLANEDTDYETQRARYVQFQKERRDFYGGQLDQDLLQDFDTSILLPSTQHEFQVGSMAMAGLNDRVLANASQQISDLTSQSGFDQAKDDESMGMIEQILGTMVNNKVISQVKAREVLDNSRKTMRLNKWSIETKNNPYGVASRLGTALGGNAFHEVRAVAPQNFHTKMDPEVKAEIIKVSEEFGLDPNLTLAMAWQESRGKQTAVSGKGARGIFQLMPDTAAGMKVNPDDWRENIRGGVQYLSQQLNAFGGNVPLALAAYNAGPGHVQEHGGVPPFAETMKYVPEVMAMAGYQGEPVGGGEPELIPAAGPRGTQFAPQDLDGLTTQEALHFYNQAQSNIKQEEAQRNSLINAEKSQLGDYWQYAVMTGDFNSVKEAEIRLAALGDFQGAVELGKKRVVFEEIQAGLQQYNLEPLAVQAQAAEKLLMSHARPDNGGMIADMAKIQQQAWGAKIKAFETDPAGFIEQSQYYIDTPRLTPEQKVGISLRAQMALGAGLPGFTPQVISKQQALDIKNAYDKAPTTDKYDMVEGLKAEYGRFFPEVSEEAGLPSFITALSGSFDALPQMVAEKLMTAASLPASEIPGLGNEKTKADAQAAVSNSSVMQVLQGTAALLSGNEDQVRGVAAFQDAAMKANLLGMDMNDIDREYNVVNDSGFLLAVPKSQGNIRDITTALEYKRAEVAKGMTKDAAQYVDVLTSREHILDRSTTIWTSRDNVFVLIDKKTQTTALDAFGNPVIVAAEDIPNIIPNNKAYLEVVQERTDDFLGASPF